MVAGQWGLAEGQSAGADEPDVVTQRTMVPDIDQDTRGADVGAEAVPDDAGLQAAVVDDDQAGGEGG